MQIKLRGLLLLMIVNSPFMSAMPRKNNHKRDGMVLMQCTNGCRQVPQHFLDGFGITSSSFAGTQAQWDQLRTLLEDYNLNKEKYFINDLHNRYSPEQLALFINQIESLHISHIKDLFIEVLANKLSAAYLSQYMNNSGSIASLALSVETHQELVRQLVNENKKCRRDFFNSIAGCPTSRVKNDHTIACISLSPDGTQLAVGMYHGGFNVWDVAQNSYTHFNGSETVTCLEWNKDGSFLAVARENVIDIVQSSDWRCVWELQGHQGYIWSIDWHPHNEIMLASGSDDETVCIWHLHTKQLGTILQGHTHYVRGVKWSPCGTMLATASWDYSIRIWDASTFECTTCMKGDAHEFFNSLDWNSQSTQIVSASSNNFSVWDVKTTERAVLAIAPENPAHVHWHRNGNLAVQGSKMVYLYSTSPWFLLKIFDYGFRCDCVSFADDGTKMAIALSDKTIIIVSLDPLIEGSKLLQSLSFEQALFLAYLHGESWIKKDIQEDRQICSRIFNSLPLAIQQSCSWTDRLKYAPITGTFCNQLTAAFGGTAAIIALFVGAIHATTVTTHYT